MMQLNDEPSKPKNVSIQGAVSKSEAVFLAKDLQQANDAFAPVEHARSYIEHTQNAHEGLGQSQRLMLKWENLSYSVPLPKKKKEEKKDKIILDSLSGNAQPGQVLAIMGPSGGGKTSLLNVLANRTKPTSGSVTLNNRKLPKKFNKVSAYVMQDDLLLGTLTPREILTFAASLRLSSLTADERKQRVEYLITILSLSSCADTRVGRPFQRGISGGERKRTAIGYEMVTNPSLIFLDEPTTGLDSFTALSVIRSLEQLAKQGRTVICTIHQPSSEIFALFNKLILLSSGKIVYSGPAPSAVNYFNAIGYRCPTYSNPSDYFMKVLKSRDETDLVRVAALTEAWKARGASFLQGVAEADSANIEADDSSLAELERPEKGPSWYRETSVMTWRSTVDTYRNPITFYARLAQFIIVGLFLGATYIPLGHDQTSIQDRIGVLFFLTMGMFMLNANSIILTFPLERNLLIRDQYSGMYRVWTYFLGKMISELPFGVAVAICAAVVPYWFVGLANTARQFFTFLLTVWVQMFMGGSIGLLIGCSLPNAELAVTVSPVFIVPFVLFGGFFTNTANIGPWFSWIQYISPFKWGFEAFGLNELTGLQLYCEPNQYVVSQGQQICPVTTGEQVISQLSYTSTIVWEPLGILVGIGLVFRVISLIALQLHTRKALSRN